MAKRTDLSIKIDYLSMTCHQVPIEEMIEVILNLPFALFFTQEARIKHQSYTKLYQFGHIKVYADKVPTEDNPLGLGCYLVLSGKGCDEYGLHLSAGKTDHDRSFGAFFRKCRRLLGHPPRRGDRR